MLALLVCSSYSYSEEVFGSTTNAASAGYNWVMTNLLPAQAGLQVNGVVYRYTAVKNTDDDMVVHVQNENARGAGYIFRSSDDWSGLPGNTINKAVPVNNVDISYWGNGSIQVDGFGTVEDARVVYTYQYDPCFDPQSRPDCPGYIAPIDYDIDQSVIYQEDQQYVQDELDRKKTLLDEEEQEEADRKAILAKKRRETDERLEVLLGFVNTSALAQEQLIRHGQLTAMNGLSSSYYTAIPGGTYQETIALIDSKLPDAKKGLRVNLATQILHQKMMDLQYANSTNTTGEQ